VRGAGAVVTNALQEAVRRRILLVVAVLTAAFLALYAVGAHYAFRGAKHFAGPGIVDTTAFTGATIFGLAMFATLFLGAVLAIFLTAGVVRGDAETGMLQPVVVRPVGRTTLLVARFVAASSVTSVYVLLVYAITMAITLATGDWRPDHMVGPALALALGVAVIAALGLLGSVFLSSTANGIAAFMMLGTGLTAGLLGQIGDALNSQRLEDIARVATWAAPFEALYQAGLHALVSDTKGLTGVVLKLGPFGAARAASPALSVFAVAYVATVLGVAAWAFGRRDL